MTEIEKIQLELAKERLKTEKLKQNNMRLSNLSLAFNMVSKLWEDHWLDLENGPDRLDAIDIVSIIWNDIKSFAKEEYEFKPGREYDNMESEK